MGGGSWAGEGELLVICVDYRTNDTGPGIGRVIRGAGWCGNPCGNSGNPCHPGAPDVEEKIRISGDPEMDPGHPAVYEHGGSG